MTPDYTDLIATIRWHMQQTEQIADADLRTSVWVALKGACNRVEYAQQAIEKQHIKTEADVAWQGIAAAVEEDVERILAMSDEDVLAECRANGDDPDRIAAECRTLLERAQALTAEQSAHYVSPDAPQVTITE